MSLYGIFEIDLGLSKVFYIDGISEKVLVDTGLKPLPNEVIDYFVASKMPFSKDQLALLRKGSRSAIVKFLKNNGFKVDCIICTHCHGDHIGNLAQLKEELRVSVAAHRNDIPIIEGKESLPKPKMVPEELYHHFDCKPCEVDIPLEDGQRFNEEIDIIHMEGHTRGSICLLVKGIALITGDSLLGKGASGANTPNKLNPPSKDVCVDWDMGVRNLKKLMDYQFESLLPSHGETIKNGAKRELELLIKELKI